VVVLVLVKLVFVSAGTENGITLGIEIRCQGWNGALLVPPAIRCVAVSQVVADCSSVSSTIESGVVQSPASTACVVVDICSH
jgi:hypothetical protein